MNFQRLEFGALAIFLVPSDNNLNDIFLFLRFQMTIIATRHVDNLIVTKFMSDSQMKILIFSDLEELVYYKLIRGGCIRNETNISDFYPPLAFERRAHEVI